MSFTEESVEKTLEEIVIGVGFLTIQILGWLLWETTEMKTGWKNVFFLVATGAQQREDNPIHTALCTV